MNASQPASICTSDTMSEGFGLIFYYLAQLCNSFLISRE